MDVRIRNFAANLSRWGCEIRETPRGVAWNTWGDGQSEVSIQAINVTTLDGDEIVAEARFTHTFGPKIQESLSPERAAFWNIMASLSAMVSASEEDGFRLIARAPLYKGDDDAWERIYAPFLCTEAYQQPMAILEAVNGATSDPGRFGLENVQDHPPFSEASFLEAREYCLERAFDATASATGLSVEFPWHSAKDAGPDKLTFLCRLSIQERHPCLGRGLLASLQVPTKFADQQAVVNAVTELNRWESEATDMVPLFGAWCMDPRTRNPMFTMFLPNELCVIRPTTVLAWMMHRARRVSSLLAQLGEPN